MAPVSAHHVVQAARLPQALAFVRGGRGIEVVPVFLTDTQAPPAALHRTLLDRAFEGSPLMRLGLPGLAEWLASRLLGGALRVAWGSDAFRVERHNVSGVRLARWLAETIRGESPAARVSAVESDPLIERRLGLAKACAELRASPLPGFIRKEVGKLRRGGRVLWLPALLLVEVRPGMGVCTSRIPEGSPPSLEQYAALLLQADGALAPLAALASTRVEGQGANQSEELAADVRFLAGLPPGAQLAGTVAPYHTLLVERLPADPAAGALRVSALAPEHVAATGDGGFVHWPKTRVGLVLSADLGQAQYPEDGAVWSGFLTWERAVRWHPIVNWNEAQHSGSVCVSDTVQVATSRAAADGLAPGAVLALALAVARDTLLYGVNGQNARTLYRRYDRFAADAGVPRYSYLSADQARALAAARRIELVPWQRRAGPVAPEPAIVI